MKKQNFKSLIKNISSTKKNLCFLPIGDKKIILFINPKIVFGNRIEDFHLKQAALIHAKKLASLVIAYNEKIRSN